MKYIFLLAFSILFTVKGSAQSFSLADCRWGDAPGLSEAQAGGTYEYAVTFSALGGGNTDAIVNFTAPGGATGWDLSKARVVSTNMAGTWTTSLVFGGTVQFKYTGEIFDGDKARLGVTTTHDGMSAILSSEATNAVPGSSTCNSAIPVNYTITPVKLSYFNVAEDQNDALLTWSTVSESNNAYFIIERSLNGVDFEAVDKVNSKAVGGNSTATLQYDYTDNKASSLNNQVFYRLNQVDLDGTSTFSEIKSVTFKNANAGMSIFPNPISRGGQSNIVANQIDKVAVYNQLGQLVSEKEYNHVSSAILDTTPLEVGLYMVIVNDEDLLKLTVLQ